MRRKWRLTSLFFISSLFLGWSGAMAESLPKIELDSPRLSPNGEAIMFAFKYGDLPWKLAVISADPADKRVGIVMAPPTMNWITPAWAPDNEHFAAISYCVADNCYEGVTGFHVWRFKVGDHNIKRLTPDRPNVRRASPMFGDNADEVYWVLSSEKSEGVKSDVSERFVARASSGQEVVVFPEPAPMGKSDRLGSNKLRLISLYPQSFFSSRQFYFISMVGYGGTIKAATDAAKKPGLAVEALLRYADGAIELVRDVEVKGVDSSCSGAGFAYTTRPSRGGDQPTDFHIVESSSDEVRFRFDRGFARSLSVSASLDTVVFRGERQFRGEASIWLHRKGMSTPMDLDVPERLRAEVARQIELEHKGQGGTP